MAIRIGEEKLLTLEQAAKLLPKDVTVETLRRWIVSGYKGIKLEGCGFGASLGTSEEALQRFSDALVQMHIQDANRNGANGSAGADNSDDQLAAAELKAAGYS